MTQAYAVLLDEFLSDLGVAEGAFDEGSVVEYETEDLLITIQPIRDGTALLIEIDIAPVDAAEHLEASNYRQRLLHELNGLARHSHDGVIVRVHDVYVLSHIVSLAHASLQDLKGALQSSMLAAQSLRKGWAALESLVSPSPLGAEHHMVRG